jgi:hypothetical protein
MGHSYFKVVVVVVLSLVSLTAVRAQDAGVASSDARLQKAYRFQKGGWTYVHLEGSPSEIGYQHGFLLAFEISDALEAIKLLIRIRPSATGNSSARPRVKCSGRTLTPSTSRSCRE